MATTMTRAVGKSRSAVGKSEGTDGDGEINDGAEKRWPTAVGLATGEGEISITERLEEGLQIPLRSQSTHKFPTHC